MNREELLRAHLEMETEGERSPAQTDPTLVAEQLLEHRRFELVMRMTAVRFAKLTPTEKRNYVRWAKHFARVFSEKAAMFERNSPAELDLPTYLQARA